MRSPQAQGEAFYVRLLPLLVLAASLSLTYLLWQSAQQDAARKLQAEFNADAREIAMRIEQRMTGYEQVLRGARGLFAASVSVERDEFHDYVSMLSLEKTYPGIQGVGFAQIVPPQQIDRHTAAIRNQGFPDYAIHPAGRRDFYTSVIYLEPFNERNRRAFGYDMYSDREQPRPGDAAPGLRRAALERARDSGEAAISGKIRLLMEMEADLHPQAGVLMYLPVYRNGAPTGSLDERRSAITGWIYAPFRMRDLMTGILGAHAADLDIEIFDGEELSDSALLYDDDGVRMADHRPAPQLHTAGRIEIAGRIWTLSIHSLPGFEARLDRAKPQIIAYAAAGMSLLLVLLAWVLMRDREHTLQSARRTAENHAALHTLIENSLDAMVRMDDRGVITEWNKQAEKIFGWERHEAIGRMMHETIIPSRYRDAHVNGMRRLLRSGEKSILNSRIEISALRRDGREFPVELAITEIGIRDKIEFCGFIRDISERRASEEHMQRMAHYDSLTGLPNRVLVTDRIRQALVHARRDNTRMALMFIDLDNFKPVNDDFGHDIGDLLLKEVAQRLRDCMRESDTAARMGGDEFLVLLPVIETEQDATMVAEKIRHALCQPFDPGKHRVNISTSIGIAVYPDHGNNEKILIRNADLAMYHAKQDGRNSVRMYQPDMRDGT